MPRKYKLFGLESFLEHAKRMESATLLKQVSSVTGECSQRLEEVSKHASGREAERHDNRDALRFGNDDGKNCLSTCNQEKLVSSFRVLSHFD